MTASERYEHLKQRLSDALATSDKLTSLVDGLSSDDPFRRFSPWLETANTILRAETTSPSEAIADHLASLESAVRRARPQTWPATNFGAEVKSTWGIFIADLATASEAARDLGKTARDPSIGRDLRNEVERAPLQSLLQGMLRRLDVLSEQLEALKREAAAERTTSVQQTGLINVYVDEMKMEASVLKSEVSANNTIDLGSVGRSVERMTELTADFVTTTKKLGHLISLKARRFAEAVRGGVHRVVRGTRAMLRVVRNQLKLRITNTDDLIGADNALSAKTDMEALVRNMILQGELPPRELAQQVTSLDFGGAEWLDLTPLANLTQLQRLNLMQTLVSDLAPLARLTQLQSLDLMRTQVRNLAPLASLTQLQILDLMRTQVSDLAPLANLTALQILDLMKTQVSDLAPLAGLTQLQTLNLMQTQVRDLAPLASLTQLQSLDLRGTRVSDLAPLAGLTRLQRLDLRETQVSDLAPLARLTRLQSLALTETQVSDLAPLASLTQLQSLALTGTQVSDLVPLASLTQLLRLDLEGTLVSDLAPIASLTQLQSLDLRGMQISDLTPLASYTRLQSLNLMETQVRDLAPLAGLTQLQRLDLMETPVRSLAPLASLTQLQSLDLRGTQVSDLSPLAGLTRLQRLNLMETQVSDLAPLAGLTKLQSLDLMETQVSDLRPVKHVSRVIDAKGIVIER